MKHVVFKIQPGKENTWRAWGDYLRQHEAEVIKTLEQENCVFERSVMFECNGETFMVGSVQFEGEPKKADMDVALNIDHKKVKSDCLQAIARFEGCFDVPAKCEIVYEFDVRKER